MYESKLGIRTMEKLARFRRLWKAWAYLGIPISFAGMGFILYHLVTLFLSPPAGPAIVPIIPGVRIPGVDFYLPFWYGILALFAVLVIHEGAHGVVSLAHKIKVKSTGVGLFAILPFAFVRPDENTIKKASTKQKLSIYSAGSFANITTAAIIMAVNLFILAPLLFSAFTVDGLTVSGVDSEFPAHQAGLQVGDTILEIDNIPASNLTGLYSTLTEKKPGDTAEFQLQDRTLEITATQNPDNSQDGRFGFSFEPVLTKNVWYATPIQMIYTFLSWTFVLSLGIGLFNLLPIGPIDGGKMFKEVLDRVFKKKERATKAFIYFSVLSLALLLAVIVLPMIQ